MRKVVAIIQARMGASRLAGKMMLSLHGSPIVEWVVRRVSWANQIDEVIAAIPDTKPDDVLYNFLRKEFEIKIFRGSENDVLGRIVKAGRQTGATHVVRVCADNPFVCGEVIDDLVHFFSEHPCDYAYNQGDGGITNTYPDGLGAEIAPFDILEWLDKHVTEPRHREHCFSFISEHADHFDTRTFNPSNGHLSHPELKLDLDTLEDYCRLALKPLAISSSPVEIIRAFLKEPQTCSL